MSRSTISTFKLFEMFPDEESACKYLESRLWPAGVQCPECKHMDRITRRLHGFYRCNACKLDFTVRTGTIFERSHVPLHKWVYAMYLLVTARKGISSMQLAKEIVVTQKTAWFMLHRLREACDNDGIDRLRGSVEIDETFRRDSSSELPEVLDRISDRVLAYRPKPKTKGAKRRARRKARRQRNQ